MKTFLDKLAQRVNLSQAEAESAVGAMMQGDASEEQIADFLLSLRAKGEAVSEVVGAARALRQHMTPIKTSREFVVDTCGTGGAGTGTFNISTTAAIISAASGVPVAKHGNRKVSSKSGSADVFAELGVNIDCSHDVIERCLDELGLCFCFAQRLHPSMKHVGPVRQRLGVPTIFNLLGPLCNPASAAYQVLGVGRPALRPLISEALSHLGTTRAVVLHGEDGLCEVTNAAATMGTMIEGDEQSEFTWHPSDFGLEISSRDSLLVESPAESAEVIRGILAGRPGAPRDISIMNAATAIWICGQADDLASGAQAAANAIDSGEASHLLRRLAEMSQE